MLDCVDRVVVAVRNAEAAAATFEALLGAGPGREIESAHLGARGLVLALGASEVELLAPAGRGPVGEFLEARGEGLFAAGFASARYEALRDHLARKGAAFTEEGDRLHLDPGATGGTRAVISPLAERSGPGPLSHIYEVTKMTGDWHDEANHLADLFDLKPDRFCPIESEAFGYTGSLLLFDPPARLDRIELSQVVDPASAMGRFVAKRGETLYMCFAETDDPKAIVSRLEKAGARRADAPGDHGHEHFFIHPASLHGVLMGVSRTNVAWLWSGRPDLAS